MRSLLDTTKAFYQSASAVLPEKWAKVTSAYNVETAEAMVKRNLKGRFGGSSGLLNLIMVVPVNNWETVLMEKAKSHGAVNHLELEGKDHFFKNIDEWHEYRKNNIVRIKKFFEENYIESDINVLFLYLSEFYIDPEELKNFKIKNTVIVNFSWDDRLHYVSSHAGQSVGVQGIAKNSDINLTMALAPLSRYMSDNTPVFYWYGKNLAQQSLIEIPELEFNKVMFFGTSYGYRTELVNYLLKRDLPLDAFGSGWGTDFISYVDLDYRIPRYSLCLGVSSIGYTRNLTCVKGRDIEVPSAGGLYLTNDSNEINHIYTSEKEILTYKSMDNCYKIASEVLSNPSAYRDIRIAGQQRAMQFSWTSRFAYLKDILIRFCSQEG